MRATAFGLQAAFGRLGAILGTVAFGEFAGSNVTVPLVLVSAMLVLGGGLTMLLKETKGMAIH